MGGVQFYTVLISPNLVTLCVSTAQPKQLLANAHTRCMSLGQSVRVSDLKKYGWWVSDGGGEREKSLATSPDIAEEVCATRQMQKRG